VPIIQTVFQSGAFDANSTSLVAQPLAFLALGLIWYALVEVLARIFYAMQDTTTPVVAAIIIIVINVALGMILVDRMGYAGLGLSLAASTAVEALILMVVLQRRIGGFDEVFGFWFVRVLVAAAAMVLVAEAVRGLLTDATRSGEAPRVVQLMLLGYTIGVTGLSYFVAAYYLRLPEVDQSLDQIGRRLPFVRRFLPRRP
jgi:putative peptidoglycan lipid II flippase